MAYGTGIDGQVGMAEESTYGTFVAPTRFFEFNSSSLVPTVIELNSTPIGVGRVLRTSRALRYMRGGSGDLEVDAVTRGQGLLWKHMLGDVATAQVASTTEYTHTFTPDNTDGKRGLSATVQAGVPATDGTIHPFSFTGGKVTAWELSAAVDEILKISTTWIFSSATTSQAIATPSYAEDPIPFTFLGGAATIDGDAVSTIKGATVSWAESLDEERNYLGGTRGEPLANGMLEVTGTLEQEFNSLTAFNAWIAGTEIVDLELTFEGPTIPSESNPYKLVITIPSLKYTGEAPAVSGPEIVQQNTPFQALYNGTDPVITVVLHTDDETP